MMRITSQMMLSNYKSDVSDAFASLNTAMRHAYDYRAFDRPSDDPLAASQTFDIHFQMDENADYSDNINNLQGTAASADKILQNIWDTVSEADSHEIKQALDGTMNGSNRGILADHLLSLRDDIVSQMNTKYGDSYIFGGSNQTQPPFEMVNDQLYYRGVNVDTGKLKDGTDSAVSLDTLADPDKDMTYVDIGLGLNFTDDGKINSQSVFNSSMPAISYLGYGGGADSPKNICSVLTELSTTLKATSNTDKLGDTDRAKLSGYATTLKDDENRLLAGQANLGSKTQFLNSIASYTADEKLSLSQKDNNVEYMDCTDAIETYYSQLYCYNASLKVGGQILQQSLMDYLK